MFLGKMTFPSLSVSLYVCACAYGYVGIFMESSASQFQSLVLLIFGVKHP